MNHLGTNSIETKRLILRKFMRSDSVCMFKNWASDSKVTEFLSWSPHKSHIESEEIIDSWISRYEDKSTYNWAIELKETHEVIGNIMVIKLEESNISCEIGYCIGSEFWNKGFTTEALNAVIHYLFSKIELNRISAKHDILNPSSGKVMKKSNMVYEGTLREVQFKNNRFCTLSVYSVLRNEWLEKNN